MSAYMAEFVATAFLVLLGDAVVANVILGKTKGNGSGLIVIAFGWSMAVLIPALMFGPASGAHMNPAVTLGLASIGAFSWLHVPGYIAAQFAGAFVGAVLVYMMYKDHFDATEDAATKLGVFCTGPAIRNVGTNFFSEFLATFVLLFCIIGIGKTPVGGAAALGTFGVAGIILACGVSLGGTTGYAINPARDLGPRIAHFLLPIKNKGGSDWEYAWIPVVAPVCGAIAAALASKVLL